MFCGGNVRYNTTAVPRNDDQLLNVINNQTLLTHNITGLEANTSYIITTMALRMPSSDVVKEAVMEVSTLPSQSKYV